MNRSWHVLATGPRALVQDRGRPGLAHLGVARSGAADRAAHGLGQRLLGNDEDTACLEVTFGGLQVRAQGDCLITVTGAPAMVTVDDRRIGHAAVVPAGDGAVIALAAPESGLRTYLSVRGGIDVAPVLGSRSTDLLAGLGPAPLQPGDRLPLGRPGPRLPEVDVAPVPVPASGRVTLRIAPGPRIDWLADPADLVQEWSVSGRSDRIGIRLEGGALARAAQFTGAELPSEGVVRGSIQVPPAGEPVLFLADHPVTGGYPVAAVVLDADTDLAAQLPPGQPVRLRWAR